MASLQAIRNHILFRFEREVVRKNNNGNAQVQFKDETSWGFQHSSYDDSTKTPQWAIAISVGNEVQDVKNGDRILIDALKWTHGIETDDGMVWRTDEEQVLAVDDSHKS